MILKWNFPLFHEVGFVFSKKRLKFTNYICCLIHFKTNIREAFIKNEDLTAIFFDLEKAYDMMWKYGVMKDLHDLDMKGRLLQFIDGFLSKRKFRVHIDSTLSGVKNQEKSIHRAVYCP